MPVLVAMVPKKATIKQKSQMKNNKKKSPQNSSSGSKLPKSKKELFDESSFSFCLLNLLNRNLIDGLKLFVCRLTVIIRRVLNSI